MKKVKRTEDKHIKYSCCGDAGYCVSTRFVSVKGFLAKTKPAVITMFVFLGIAVAPASKASAQEFAGQLHYNALLNGKSGTCKNKHARITAAGDTLTLPFFEDFTGYDVYPDTNKWVDYEVYINNTMASGPVSRGVATFDALNSNGFPYDSFSNINFRYADSLTSKPIDLGAIHKSDSLYFSFFFQPQGNGFRPLPQDSLMLYFRDRFGGFVKIWATAGSAIQPFRQIMISMQDTLYYHNAFQFRFINKAALYWADAVWNVDYIRLDQNRSAGDTLVSDAAFTSDPTFLLNDYTSMPYDQFMAHPTAEVAAHVSDSIRNSNPFGQTVSYSYSVTDLASGAVLSASATPGANFFTPHQTQQVTDVFSVASGYPVYPDRTRVEFQTQYNLTAPFGGVAANDTVVKKQVFDNYLAYDDGTAEKSYFLILSPTLDGRIAVEYHLNQPDTMRGMAIYFGRQAPMPTYKSFNIFVYSALAGVNGAGADAVLDSQEFYIPAYTDSQNHFWVYTFDRPVVLPAGTFYAGTQQPAASGADTLYFGLDVNRIGGNHAYYNVLHAWDPSLISGAIMMRPILGRQVTGTYVSDVRLKQPKWGVTPNPATDKLRLEMDGVQRSVYRITDILGHSLLQGTAMSDEIIDISSLAPGMYLMNIVNDGVSGAPQKFIKL